ncbi:FRG domain-containing protein [Apibacter muscae]|uniref:FRG domain-containing protein n=1 Tax=Apibacter muscae TaxID=2509004 RepID=A0A563DEE0_9FLAO|nr:FRG domain-containing protein [Apibacter muscae]TWP28429.1 FRG domain-containing protein [Apibacter muscae]
MEENKKVKSIQDYLREIEKLNTENNINNLFFRGHSDKKYELKPGIYRDKLWENGEEFEINLVDSEDKMYRDIISKLPEKFEGKNTLESLALMQHYDFPTRLLDITSNPLVALYFACCKEQGIADGEIIAFGVSSYDICHYDSDRVTILSNIAKCDIYFYNYDQYFHIIDEHEKAITELLNRLNPISGINEEQREILEKKIKRFVFTKKERIKEMSNLIITEFISTSGDDYKLGNSINKIKEDYFNEYIRENKFDCHDDVRAILYYEILRNIISYSEFIKEEYIRYINKLYFSKLLYYIREDKPSFLPLIDPKDVEKILVVKPKLDNPRIIKQEGAFLIFGIKQKIINSQVLDYKGMACFDESWILRGKHQDKSNIPRIIIDKKSKNKILEELSLFGINEAFLFPEIDKVATYIKKQYIDKSKKEINFPLEYVI